MTQKKNLSSRKILPRDGTGEEQIGSPHKVFASEET